MLRIRLGLVCLLSLGLMLGEARCVAQQASPELAETALTAPLAAEPVLREGDLSGGALTLTTVEELAIGASASLQAIEARVRAARWHCLQVGLRPNPSVGYVAAEVGNEGLAGQQGAFVSQQFVRGGKLTYAQAVASKEARRLEQEFGVERMRLLTDVRTAYYDAYLAQLEVELSERLTELSRRASEASRRLLEAGEGKRTDALLAEIEAQRADASRRSANQLLLASWRRLAPLTGLSATPQPLNADRDALLRETDWATTQTQILATSPELAARLAAIDRARCEVAYQRSVAVPDVSTQFSVQYDDSTNYTVAGVQIGVPLQIWNRNQGAIGRAQAELTAAQRDLEAKEQTLERELAAVYGRFQAARERAEALSKEVLPRAQENLDLAAEGYQAGEINFLDLLTVQRTFFEVNLESLAALRELNTTAQLLRGGLLAGSGATSSEGL